MIGNWLLPNVVIKFEHWPDAFGAPVEGHPLKLRSIME